MTVAGIELVGLPDLVARLTHARDGLADLTDVNRDMAQLAAREADPLTPRHTGALQQHNDTVADATGWGLVNGQPYALFVHAGTRVMRARPWLLEAATDTEDQWTQLLADHMQQLLDG